MGKDRADLGFADALDDFNPAEWELKPKRDNAAERAVRTVDRQLAEAAGFKSREARSEKPGEGSAPRRRRTGRNAQFNLKARPETIDAFCAVADRQGWGLGETLEYAVALLEREYKA